ncbi:MAG: hypothetical protein CMK09_14945 [Ponticaulis sp.]|nr:hypothetical protein [Ponticaulis sp.]|tara:strand:+ start:4126 stop:4857 length:732 start_codon:yes stop_codon:yes gene_type:complete
MDLGFIASAFLMASSQPPLDTALSRTEPPISLRAAFTVELTDGEAFREVRFDPRIELATDRWTVIAASGESEDLDHAVEAWGNEISPDGWLIPDDLRASMGGLVETEDMGSLWRIQFEHQPSDNDGPIDIWASEHLVGYSWLEPVSEQFTRVEYIAPAPFDWPGGGRVEAYHHTYVLAPDPTYGITFVAAFEVDVTGEFLTAEISRSYRARITDVDFFFVDPIDEARYRPTRRAALQAVAQSR